MYIKSAFSLLLTGLILITIIDTIGSVASRKLNFKYSSLLFLSLMIYMCIGYYTTKQCSLLIALIVNSVIGIYDATIGLRLSIILKANNDLIEQKGKELLTIDTVKLMITVSVICTLIGYLITKF